MSIRKAILSHTKYNPCSVDSPIMRMHSTRVINNNNKPHSRKITWTKPTRDGQRKEHCNRRSGLHEVQMPFLTPRTNEINNFCLGSQLLLLRFYLCESKMNDAAITYCFRIVILFWFPFNLPWLDPAACIQQTDNVSQLNRVYLSYWFVRSQTSRYVICCAWHIIR